MITINLLPQEYRRKERTPVVILLPVLLGLVFVLSAGAVACYVHFAWLAEVENDREMLQMTFDQKKPRLVYEENLLAEESEYEKRADTIRNIASSRIVMTKKLDELADVIAEGETSEGEGYLIWLNELKTSPPKPTTGRSKAAAKSGGEIVMRGYALADRDPLQDYNRFHAAIKNAEMFEEFLDLEDPAGKINVFSDDKLPRKGWEAELTLTMKDPTEIRKAVTAPEGRASREKTK